MMTPRPADGASRALENAPRLRPSLRPSRAAASDGEAHWTELITTSRVPPVSQGTAWWSWSRKACD